MIKRWKNIPATLNRCLNTVTFTNECEEIRDENDRPIPQTVADAIYAAHGISVDVDLEISFNVTGYYASGSMYKSNGDPGDPPEGDEERTLDGVTVGGDKLDPRLSQVLFDHYQDEINEVEVDTDQSQYEPSEW